MPEVGFDHFESLHANAGGVSASMEILERPANAPDSCLDLLGIRSTNHEDLLDASKREAFKRPVEEGSIAYREQTLAQTVTRTCQARSKGLTSPLFAQSQGAETLVEAVCENDRLEHILFARQILLLSCCFGGHGAGAQ